MVEALNNQLLPTKHKVPVCVNVVPPFYHANSHQVLVGRTRRYVKIATSCTPVNHEMNHER